MKPAIIVRNLDSLTISELTPAERQAAARRRRYQPRHPDRGWITLGACRGHDPDLWFPEIRGSVTDSRAAKAICRTCPVRQQCLDYALADPNLEGIWGAMAVKERMAERSRRRYRAAS